MKLALCQLDVSDCKVKNLASAYKMLDNASALGADMAILPEMFCINYVPADFRAAAESVPDGECCQMLMNAAREFSLTIVGGSIPELCNGRIYNTSVCYSNSGSFIGAYRKAHLFDINLEGCVFLESDTVSAGNKPPLIFDSPIKTGVSICFDIRFPEWSRLMMQQGVDLIALPAAFSPKTGPLHWELLLRSRALDNQCFVAGVAPAASKCSYGHTMLASPNGSVICDLGTEQALRVIDLPMTELDKMRNSIPIKTARRIDLY